MGTVGKRRRVADAEGLLTFRIEQDLTVQINNGSLAPEARLPSIRAAATFYQVSRFTVGEAYERLVAKGYLTVRAGSGFFAAPGQKKRLAPVPSPEKPRIDGEWLMRQQMLSHWKAKPGAGMLPDAWYPDADFRSAIRGMMRDQRVSLASYGDPQGYMPLRERIAEMLQELRINAGPDQVSLTIGASHGMEIAMRALLRPGDIALVDNPGYFNMHTALAHHGATVVGVARTRTGPCLQALRAILEKHRPKVFFTQSVFQNPTGDSTDPGTAHAILRMAQEYDFHIVENDVYGCFDDAGRTRIATLDQLNRVILAGSFSKAVSGSTRAGFLAAHPELLQRINRIKLNGVIGSPAFAERAVYAFLVGGNYRKHIGHLRERLVLARGAAKQALAETGFTGISAPEGGYLLCAQHPQIASAAHFAECAAAQGILMAPGEMFTLGDGKSNWFRFNASQLADAETVDILNAFTRKYLSTA
ncbi:PLP-dependent aminotransferase family protein [Oxalobacteraceae bacterium]|nr:PLP-dependent aminotransferase family protein [Oxalobacteraceae bacterium]